MEIWILSHEYDYGNVYDKYKWNDEGRVLGAYYTKEEGLKALEKYKKIKGSIQCWMAYWSYHFSFNNLPNFANFIYTRANFYKSSQSN